MKRVFTLLIFLLPFVLSSGIKANDHHFTLVLDAGHGGRESGAVGKRSMEKNINLAVTLLVGDMIKKAHPDVKIVYTRTKDITVSLPKRAQIANNAKADLFISIHANSAGKNNAVKGAEVFTYGPTKSNENLEVLKRENEITYLEDEFKELSVADFLNPVETSIIIEAMQQVYHGHSFDLASMIQKELVAKAGRGNRGVKSDNFAVLRYAGMPSVLIELDFISCPEAENYMLSKQGQKTLAQCILNAFTEYKKKFDIRAKGLFGADKEDGKGTDNKEKKEGKKDGSLSQERVYKVQIFTSPSPASPTQLKGYKANYYMENGVYKYTIGETSDWNEIQQIRKNLLKDFSDAFIVKFENGERIYN